MSAAPRALVAEDEPLLALALHEELLRLWPELQVVDTVGDGHLAVERALQLLPDVLFFDIRMPGQDGMDAVAELVDAWPSDHPFPMLVFVTAYDEYALRAFDAQAMDYVLKPVRADRLIQTVHRLQAQWRQRLVSAPDMGPVWAQIRALLSQSPSVPVPQPLKLLQASQGAKLRMVAVEEVIWLEAADKYIRVFTQSGDEVLLRTPLKELLQRLDPDEFWQIHRGTVVRAKAIESVTRDATGKLSLRLKGQTMSLGVSRLFAHRFRAM